MFLMHSLNLLIVVMLKKIQSNMMYWDFLNISIHSERFLFCQFKCAHFLMQKTLSLISHDCQGFLVC